MNKKLYLSGPMTGLPDWNRKSFYDAAKQLTDLGYEVINPFDLPEPFLAPKNGEYTYAERWAAYLARDVFLFLRNTPYMVILLPGWENSKGACLEKAIACEAGIPATTLGNYLKYYVKRKPYVFPWPGKKKKKEVPHENS